MLPWCQPLFLPLSACACLLTMFVSSWAFMVGPRSLQHRRATSTDLFFQMPSPITKDTVDDQSSWQKPLTTENIPIILETLESVLYSPDCQRKLQEEAALCTDDNYKTVPVREITGGRYEIFLTRAGTHSYTTALKLMEQVIEQLPVADNGFPRLFTDPQEALDVLVQDVTEKAQKSSGNLATSVFENFSILFSTQGCDSQPMHIDGSVTQGVYFITDKSPTTKTWHPKGDSITTPSAATDIWKKLVPGVEQSVWDEIRISLENQDQASGLNAKECIRRYGDLLLTPEDLVENSELAVARGTVRMVQPRGLHAGPASEKNRAVIFFSERVGEDSQQSESSSSATFSSKKKESYNPDIQRTSIQMLVELQMKIWPALSLEARRVMMRILQSYIQQRPIRPSEAVFGLSITNVVQWLYDCHQIPNLSEAATEIMDVIASSGKSDFREACSHFMERGTR